MNIRDAAPVAAALVLAGGMAAGVVALIASGEPAPTAQPAPAVATAGAQDCAWVPVAQCLTDEDGDDAIPASYDGCYWDADARGNHEGASYVIWRQNRG